MRAMVLDTPRRPLALRDVPRPAAASGEVVIAVEACAVCRTDLHLVQGELEDIPQPLIPGHQIVGTVVESRSGRLAEGTRVGVSWLGFACGACGYCRSRRENLCDAARFTGYTLPGGYAELVAADARFCLPLRTDAPAVKLAPLLCAGAIGYRALGCCGDAGQIGLFGFGAAAYLLAQALRRTGREFAAFTRPGDRPAQDAARSLGASWAGGSDEARPGSLDAAILFAPVGDLVPAALAAVRKGGSVVCAGIHMSDIPRFPYSLLWGERQVRSVANLTRADAEAFLELAVAEPFHVQTRSYPLEAANEALDDLAHGRFVGSAVLEVIAGR
ncbi:MAG TPA: zinc-binding alcohol dehydrogenase family protein [Gammaproteobacteria bacterium]|nr:zinc-binding alcohol dehydrogenase family protein [Gammaproteobacteria bacterium]